MSKQYPEVDPSGLLEYSVVYTDRALNHMSQAFQGVMRDIAGVLRRAYAAQAAIIVPGGGTFAMEAVARQFATGRRCLVIRNGWFSYRWSQILEMGQMPAALTVLKARPITAGNKAPFAPAPIDEVVATIRAQRPDIVFAPHVETAAGMILPDDYLRAMADAVQRSRRTAGARLHRFGYGLGGHACRGRRRAHQRTAEELERSALRRAGDAG